eukprot:958432-Pleurochrysis_carterae.AAC.9
MVRLMVSARRRSQAQYGVEYNICSMCNWKLLILCSSMQDEFQTLINLLARVLCCHKGTFGFAHLGAFRMTSNGKPSLILDATAGTLDTYFAVHGPVHFVVGPLPDFSKYLTYSESSMEVTLLVSVSVSLLFTVSPFTLGIEDTTIQEPASDRQYIYVKQSPAVQREAAYLYMPKSLSRSSSLEHS